MKPRQERDRIAGKQVLAVTGSVIVATLLGVLAAWALLDRTSASIDAAEAPRKLGVEPPLGLFDERSVGPPKGPGRPLSEWCWADRQRGTVRIPIDRAIDLYLERQNVSEENR